MARADDQTRRSDPSAGAEPYGVAPTGAKKASGGYLVSGTKHYATNASMAEWLWIGRVASDSHPKPIMFMLHKDTPGLKIDTEVWRPTGMRACVSPWLYLMTASCRRKICWDNRGNFSAKTGWARSTSPLPRTISARRGRCTTGRSTIFASEAAPRTAYRHSASASSKACSMPRG